MDNLSSHKRAGVREALAAAGAELWYLPPYSPDLNPIEMAFSKFKRMLQTASERNVERLWQACGRLLERFQEHECRNYFRHAGYRYGKCTLAGVDYQLQAPNIQIHLAGD